MINGLDFGELDESFSREEEANMSLPMTGGGRSCGGSKGRVGLSLKRTKGRSPTPPRFLSLMKSQAQQDSLLESNSSTQHVLSFFLFFYALRSMLVGVRIKWIRSNWAKYYILPL